MQASRRGFFRAILALPFAPRCIQAFRPKCKHPLPSLSMTTEMVRISGNGKTGLVEFPTGEFRCVCGEHITYRQYLELALERAPAKIGDTVTIRRPASFRA